ncbi:sensor histidine kinase [Roseivirga sp.]|uniref:sensor histidine kinase n=1 Tax=Roseivirga sp. TaxID=1964215 RepID=UPI003B8E3BB6
MRFNNFRIHIILQLLLAFVGLYGLVYYLFIDINYIRVFFLGLFLVIILFSLFSYINKANKTTMNFLLAIINNDFTVKYNSEHQGKSFDQLYETFNLVNNKFIESSQSEASEYQYIVTIINQLQIGVIAYDERERVHLSNASFNKMMGGKELINLDSIKSENEAFYEKLKAIESGENTIFTTTLSGQARKLSMAASSFKLRQNTYKLISIQDIHSELDQHEMEAWQKLIRVLTHEIMNSVAPITSLSSTMKYLVTQDELTEDKIRSLQEGLDAIEARSQGLMNFTESYKKLTRVPLPNIRVVNTKTFFTRIDSLFKPTLSGTNIEWLFDLKQENESLMIDPDLMEQVIINLLKNAKEIVNSVNGQITLNLETDSESGQTRINITDNGSGIPEEIQEKVFIPFYTTKSDGSGIGLSLARQIVQLHKGELDFNSSSEGTTFEIKL